MKPWEQVWNDVKQEATEVASSVSSMMPWNRDWSSKQQEAPVQQQQAPQKHTADSLMPTLIKAESGGKHLDAKGNLLRSPVGAEGITQLMPKTAAKPGFGIEPVKDKSEGEYLRVGKEYLGKLLDKFGGDAEKALAAYNWGFGNVQKAVGKAERFGGEWKQELPTETSQYLKKVLGGSVSKSEYKPKTLGQVALGFPKAILDAAIPSANAFDGETPYQNTFIDDVIEYGVENHIQGLIKEGKPIPTNQKVFYDSVVKGVRTKLTEKDFTPEEQTFLKDTLKSQMSSAVSQLSGMKHSIENRIAELPKKKDWTKGYPERLKELKASFDAYDKTGKVDENLFNLIRGKDLDYWDTLIMREEKVPKMNTKFGIFDYASYADNPNSEKATNEILSQRRVGNQSAKEIVHTTLGKFKAEFDPKTQEFIVRDRYDFNASGLLGSNKTPSDVDAAEGGGGDLQYRILRAYAGRKMSAERVKGREVEMRIK